METLRTGCFDEFFVDYTTRFFDQLADTHIAADIRTDLVSQLLRTSLLPVACRTLIQEFRGKYINEDLSVDMKASDRYDEYAASLRDPAIRTDIAHRYPELHRLLTLRVDRAACLVRTAYVRLGQDEAELRAANLFPGRLRSVTLCASDAHNGGKFVLAFHGDECSLIYKPRPVDVDVLVADLVQLLCTEESPLRMRPVRGLSRAGYGWQEFVEKSPCRSAAEVRQCFRSAGQWLGLFHILGATDLHYENVIADGPDLRFIDLETALCHITPESFDGQRTSNTVINESVLGTMLLPGAIANSVFDVSIAGLTSGIAEQSSVRTTFDIGGLGTNGISFQRLALTVEGQTNVVEYDGRAQLPMEHADEIETGYAEAVDLVVRSIEAVTDLIRSRPTTHIRKVLRPTAIYARFIDASVHPRYLVSHEARAELLSLIQGSDTDTSTAGNFPHVHTSEIGAMLDLDVPYFGCDIGSRNLVANQHTEIDGYFVDPPMDSLLRHVQETWGSTIAEACPSQRPLGMFNRSLIHGSMAASGHGQTAQRTGSRFLADQISDGSISERIAGIRDYVLDVRCRDDLDDAYWITPQPNSSHGWVLDKSAPTLMDAGGIAAFLDDAPASAMHAEDTDLGRNYWQCSIEPNSRETQPRSEFALLNGLAGHRLLSRHFGGLTEDAADVAHVRKTLTQLPAHLAGIDADFSNGLSGLGYALATDTMLDPVWREVAPQCRELITRALDAETYDGAGELAHGDVGMFLGIAAWTSIAGDDDQAATREVLNGCARYLRRPVERPRRHGWCRGQHGSMLASIAAHRLVGLPRQVVREMHEPWLRDLLEAETARPTTIPDVTLCHGFAGEADAMLTSAHMLGIDVRDDVERRLSDQLNAVRDIGYTGGQPFSAGTPGYVLGLAGLGHVLTRLQSGSASLLFPAYEPIRVGRRIEVSA